MKFFFLLPVVATLVFSSCKKDHEERGGIYRGPVQKFQHGKAWTWVQLDRNNKPERIAIAIDDEAMNSLDPGGDHNGGHNHANGLSLAFHPKAGVTPFQHALLDWNPNGHEPAGVYTLPHFDFHFYMTSDAERKTIPPFDVNSAGFLNFSCTRILARNICSRSRRRTPNGHTLDRCDIAGNKWRHIYTDIPVWIIQWQCYFLRAYDHQIISRWSSILPAKFSGSN